MDISFASPGWALVGLAVVLPLAALLLVERRSERVRRLLGLGRPSRTSSLGLLAAVSLIGALVALTAAQPLLARHEKQRLRRDAEVDLVLDNSRSMLAASGRAAPTRFERARQAARSLREALREIPIGLASLTDRVLLHLFPTTDQGSFLATLSRAMGVNRPPPIFEAVRATKLSAIADMWIWNFFSEEVSRRIIVVFTDGEGQPRDPAELRGALDRSLPVEVLFVHVWDADEQITESATIEPYQPDAGSRELLAAAARAVGGRVYAERQLGSVRRALRSDLAGGSEAEVTLRTTRHGLAPYAAGAALLPLAFLLLRRNRA